MKRAVRAALLVLVLLATACGSPSAASNGNEVRATPAPTGDPGSLQEAYKLLLQKSVDRPGSALLLSGALEGVTASAQRAGIAVPEVSSPQFTGDPTQDWNAFGKEFVQAASHYGSKVPPGRMAWAAIRGMVAKVGDCHTSFLEPQEYAGLVSAIQGNATFGGIGASLSKPKPTDPLVIWHVFDGTPAARAGLRAGDVILAVDGRDVSDLRVDAARDLIRGPEGGTVHLTIRRYGVSAPLEVAIARRQVSPPNVEAAKLSDDVGYLRVYAFPDGVADQVAGVLDTFDRQGVQLWVVDLRNNGGGSLQAETKLLSKLIPDGLLFYTWDRDGKRTEYRTDGSYRGSVKRMVVLVNEGTGSGGEMFAAAVQDYRLGKVVGARTAGCVGVGQPQALPDGSALQVTVARLLTGVTGRDLNHLGLTPDVEAGMSLQDVVEGRDPQLDAALRLVSP